jgi:hypothetical protein
MEWLNGVSYFFGGIFLANAIPHVVSGVLGRAFQSPFAKPSGQGLSSSKVNVLWGYLNVIAGYFLICKVGDFDIHNLVHVGAAVLGAILISLFAARHFGKFHGGDL